MDVIRESAFHQVTPPLLAVLEVLLTAHNGGREELIGTQITERTGLASGYIYPMLAKMETSGWVERRWVYPGKERMPPRRPVKLTRLGAKAARALLQQETDRKRAAPSG